MAHEHPHPRDDHGLDLVPLQDKGWTYFDYADFMKDEVIIGFLQSNGIPAVLTGGFRSPTVVKVPLERLVEARQLVSEAQSASREEELGGEKAVEQEEVRVRRTARHGDFVMLSLAVLAVGFIVYLALRQF
jgi:hypothetical protein